jgi:hypothetical protein
MCIARSFSLVLMLIVLLAGPLRGAETPVDQQKPAKPTEPINKQQLLVEALAEKHGYKLAKGEPFKYIKDPQNEERNELRRLLMSSPGHGSFDMPIGKPVPEQGEEAFEPFKLVLHMLPDGRFPFSTVSDGVITFGDVLDDVLRLKPYELDCPSNLRLTYMPGDWVLLVEPEKSQRLTGAGAAALEKILNEQCNLRVRVGWKMIERPTITIRGKYSATPAGGKFSDKWVDAQADGMFLMDARRAISYHPPVMVGTFEEFLESLGYLLMMPVVNEGETLPGRRLVTWNEAGKGIEGNERLESEHEKRVLQSLSEQLGYEFRVEPREVKLLSIEPVEP